MIERQLKYLVSFVFLVSLVFTVGCGKKKTAPPPPPPPDVVAPGPTAEITATPTVVTAGDKVVLAWRTTNATDISIEGIGAVSAEGTQTVNPTASINYHLVAHGGGGSADATARVTVNTPVAAVTNNTDTVDENSFHQNVQDVFYDYDSYEVRADSQAIASKDASFLAAHPTVKVVVGGYCDERGSTEYNLALGENRANAAKQALATAGVSPDRLRVVSYGKEKQFCSEHDESCWQQNRRGQFSLDK